jgi:hypothetical protein
MENSTNLTPNQNDNTKPNINSIDGFTRPAQVSPTSDVPISSLNQPSPTPDTSSITTPDPVNSTPPQDSGAPVLSAPITSGNMDQKKSKLWTIILVILLLVVFVGGIYGVYAYQQKKINNLNSQVNALTLQNSNLKTQLSKSTGPSVTINTQSGSTTSQSVFKIPELGVSLTVPSNLADLTYVLNSSKTQANLSTQNLAVLDPACTASATVAPLGSILKANGQFPTTPSTTTTLIKQYPTYYIAYVKPTAACSTVTQVNNLTNALVADLKNTFSTIALITN